MTPADSGYDFDLGAPDTIAPHFGGHDSLDVYDDLASHRGATPHALPGITELPNPLTTNIDVANAEGIVRLMRQVDAQTLNGYQDFTAIADRQMLSVMVDAVDRMLALLDRPGRARVILSGAGTSGRLAMATARMVNRVLAKRGRPALASYTIPGGDEALVVAQENAEDSIALGVRDIDRAVEGARNVVYFGITCGLSAPYVMGQVEHLRDRPDTLIVLLGFNPPDRARASRIDGWDSTCQAVVARLAADPRHLLLTPVVGPEAITGSTRLKGGTATLLLIQMLTFCALGRGGFLTDAEAADLRFGEGRTIDSLRVMLRHYEDARTLTYLQSDHLAALIHRAGHAIRAGRHVYYLGRGSYGLYALFDAAECPPTFGAEPTEFRGFIEGGWETVLGQKAAPPAAASRDAIYRVGFRDFEKDVAPHLAEGDLVIGIEEIEVGEELRRLLALASARGASTAAIVPCHRATSERLDVDVFLPLELLRAGITSHDRSYAEMAVKLALNSISTGAYVLAGKVFGNRMIDLRLTNSKLLSRAVDIIADLLAVSHQAAHAALLSAIHGTDSIGPRDLAAPASEHCAAAARQAKVVPTAMLLATGHYTIAEAREALDGDPVVRNLIGRHLSPTA